MRRIALALLVLAFASSPARAERAGIFERDDAGFDIRQSGRRIGREDFVYYATKDTVFSMSTVRLDGLPDDSPVPIEKRTTFFQRRTDTYPLFFEVIAVGRDTSQRLSVSCVFRDTTVMVYREAHERGTGEGLALPPGRLYVFEPGVYLPVQILMADFLEGTQQRRRQSVFVPASKQFIALALTRGPRETVRVAGRTVHTTRVGMADDHTQFVGWVDADGRLWRLEAVGQGLVIERRPIGAKAKGATPKRSAPSTTR